MSPPRSAAALVGPRLLLAFGAVALLAAALAPVASAHAVLAASTPAQGTRLDTAPLYASATFTEPLDPAGSTLQVLDANDRQVDLGDVNFTHGSRPSMRVSLPGDLPDGPYRIYWKTFSSTDSHVEDGFVGFAVGDFLPPNAVEGDGQTINALGAVGRSLAFLGLSLAFGAALFLVWVPGSQPLPRAPALEALLAGAALHLLGMVLLLQSTLSQTGIHYADLAGSTVGATLLLRLGLGAGAFVFALLAGFKRAPPRGPPVMTIVLLVAAALGSARLGHASLAGLSGIVVDVLHLLAATTWVGGLLVFLWFLLDARRNGWTPEVVRLLGVRFGTAALACVLVLLGAGTAALVSIRGAPDWSQPWSLVDGAWGRFLVAKIGLTVAMVAIAAVNRYAILEPPAGRGLSHVLQRALARWAPGLRPLDNGAPGLRRLIQVECVLGVATLVLAALLTSVSPPAEAQEPALEIPGSSALYHGSLTVTPTPVLGGTSTLRVHIETHGGIPVVENTCGRTLPRSCVNALVAQNGTGERFVFRPLGGGDWESSGVLWPRGGTWEVQVEVLSGERADDVLTFTLSV